MPERDPLLTRLTRDDAYYRGQWMAPGGLLLAHQMAEQLALAPGSTTPSSACAFHTFGVHRGLLRCLATLLRPAGRLCVAQGCFSEELGERRPPFTDTDGWDARYDTYHSPAWWRALQHIRHGQTNRPRLTHLLLTAVRRTPDVSASHTLDMSGVQP